jgi:hypothetical protein
MSLRSQLLLVSQLGIGLKQLAENGELEHIVVRIITYGSTMLLLELIDWFLIQMVGV